MGIVTGASGRVPGDFAKKREDLHQGRLGLGLIGLGLLSLGFLGFRV